MTFSGARTCLSSGVCLIEFAARIALPNRSRTSPRARPYLRPAPQWTFVTLTVCAQVSALLIKLSLNCFYCIVGHQPVRIYVQQDDRQTHQIRWVFFLPIGQLSKYLYRHLYVQALISGIITRILNWERPLRIHNGSLSLITRASYLGLISLYFSSMATQVIETADKKTDNFLIFVSKGTFFKLSGKYGIFLSILGDTKNAEN